MKFFLIHILKILSLVIIMLTPTFFLNKITTNKLINLSKNKTIYFNPKFKQSIIDFKLKQEKKDITIIGTSRTAGFEKEMFLNQSVYNYSMITWTLEDAFNLIQEIEFDKKKYFNIRNRSMEFQ